MKRKEQDNNDDDEIEVACSSKTKLVSLPLDLEIEILTKLPAKSLMNLKRVSKIWSSIIQSQRFIDSYFSMSLTQPRFIVALSNGILNKPEKKLVFFFTFSHERVESCSLVPKFDMAIPSVSFSFPSHSCDSKHGFLSVTGAYRLIQCNPMTEQVIRLPIHNRFVGYDPIGDQHKALSVQPRKHSDHLEHKVLTLGGSQRWRNIEETIEPYSQISMGVCINGFVYYGAYSPYQPMNPGVVCFDVRSEKLSYIKAPNDDVVFWGYEAIFIEYKGKLASIVPIGPKRYDAFCSFDLWILEDAEKHEWSKQRFILPISVSGSVWSRPTPLMSITGTNKAGEIIIVPKLLSVDVRPFYIFYYNLETENIRRVRLHGIGDREEFRRCYGFVGKGMCHVRIAPQHVESIAFLKDPLKLTSFQGS